MLTLRHLIGLLLALGTTGAMGAQQTRAPFHFEEATIESIHAAFASGELTCARLTKLYLDRIGSYNLRGPKLRAILTVNPKAAEIAAEMDRNYFLNPSVIQPLNCIPIVLKDNFDTFDMPTSGGNVSMKTSQPREDAYTVGKLRKAGALIIAKANLQEFARGGMSISSLGGQVLNPYDLTRTPGGSSGGTGASVAANLAVAGTGSDTGQSIRSPASANNLVGIRPTRGLVSRRGVIPDTETQDEVGPIARNASDAAVLLYVMAGYDPQDPITAFGVGRVPPSYSHLFSKDALKGARIGVMRNLFGTAERHREVNEAMEATIKKMASLGATIIRFDLPQYDALSPKIDVQLYESRTAMERYFASLPPTAPVKSFGQLVAAKTSAVQKTLEAEYAMADGMNKPEYKEHMLNRDRLRLAVVKAMADFELDAILYPLQKVLVAPTSAPDQPERNGVLSNGTGLPAVTFPAGFSKPSASAPLGVPIGAELLGRDFSEDKLLAYVYALEQAAPSRKLPKSTPGLPGEP